MALKSEQIPNKALNGEEVSQIAAKQFQQMLASDYSFQKGIAYRRVAFTITATFHFGHPHQPVVVKSRVKPDGVIEGEAPLNPSPEGTEAAVAAIEREVKLDNPNLARVQHDMPVRVQEARPPRPIPQSDHPIPDEPPEMLLHAGPEIINHEIRYDKKDYPALEPAPVTTDVSEREAARLGARARTALGLRKDK